MLGEKRDLGFRFQIWGLGFRISFSGFVFGFRVSGFGFQVFRFRFRVSFSGVRFRISGFGVSNSLGNQSIRVLGLGFENNNFTEMRSGSQAGSYSRLIDSVHHPTLGLRVIHKEEREVKIEPQTSTRARISILIGPTLGALFPLGGPIQDPVLTIRLSWLGLYLRHLWRVRFENVSDQKRYRHQEAQ